MGLPPSHPSYFAAICWPEALFDFWIEASQCRSRFAPKWEPEDDDVLDALHAYAAFRSLDPRASAASFATPCLLLSPRGDLAVSSNEEVVRFYEAVMAEARRAGYATTMFGRLTSREIDGATVAVTGSGVWLGLPRASSCASS